MISSIRNRSRLIDKWLKVIDNSAALLKFFLYFYK